MKWWSSSVSPRYWRDILEGDFALQPLPREYGRRFGERNENLNVAHIASPNVFFLLRIYIFGYLVRVSVRLRITGQLVSQRPLSVVALLYLSARLVKVCRVRNDDRFWISTCRQEDWVGCREGGRC